MTLQEKQEFGIVLIPCQIFHGNWHETQVSGRVVMVFGIATKS